MNQSYSGRAVTGRLDDKSAIVAGGASGIGREVLNLFTARGASVVVFDRDEGGAKELADRVVSRGCRAIAFSGDVTDPDSFSEAIDVARRNFWEF